MFDTGVTPSTPWMTSHLHGEVPGQAAGQERRELGHRERPRADPDVRGAGDRPQLVDRRRGLTGGAFPRADHAGPALVQDHVAVAHSDELGEQHR
jgi:hypothetical protein